MADELTHKDPGSSLTQAEFIASDGTGHVFESQAQGDILYADSATVLKRLGKDANATRVLTNTGTNNNPAWEQVTLTSGVTGTLPVANGGTNLTSLGSGVATFMGTPSSANLRAALTDETGTGGAVFASSPTLVSPALGTPGSGVLTNCTGLPTAGILDNNVTVAKIEDIARGSIIYGNASAASAELTKGGANTVLTSDGTDIAWAAAAGGAIAREGGVVTEATTTATSLADLLAIGSLTIETGEPITMFVAHRKTSGSANKNQFAFEMNSTIQQFAGSSTTNQAENGTARADVVGRDTNYLNSMEIVVGSKEVSGSGALASDHINNMSGANPNAQVTTLTFQGLREGSAITVGADEFQAYTYAIS